MAHNVTSLAAPRQVLGSSAKPLGVLALDARFVYVVDLVAGKILRVFR